MRTKVKAQTECEHTREMLMEALKTTEAELRNWRNRAEAAEAGIEGVRRGKETWMAEANMLHARLDEITKLAGRALTADG